MPESRRSRGLRAVAAVAVLSLGASGCWLQRGFTAGRERYVPGDTPITPDRADDLVELWRATGLGGLGVEPLAVGDDVFVASGAGTVSRLSASTGAVQYTVGLTDPETGGPVGLGALIDNGGELRAAWGVTRGATFAGGVARLAPDTGELLEPLVAGDYVPVDFAADGGELVTQAARVVIPLGNPQGEAYVAWRGIRASVGLELNIARDSAAAVAGDHLVWRTSTSALGWNGTACTRPSRLLDGTPSCLPDWQTDLFGTNPTAIGTDAVVFGTGGNAVKVLDAATGAVRFTGTVPNTGTFMTPAAVAGDTILVGTGDGHVVALPSGGCAPATVCAPLWQAQVGSAVYVPPTVVGDIVYVVTNDGDLVTLALHGCGAATCPAIASYPIGVASPDIALAPVYDDGRIFVATSDGQVVAFGL